MNLILASTSPRRIEILDRFGVEFMKIKPEIGEESFQGASPQVVAMALAFEKANSLRDKYNSSIIMGFDTIVVLGDEIIGKPKDDEDSFKILSKLSSNWHKVITGMAIIGPENKIVDYEESLIKFRKLDHDEIWSYIKTGETSDKAGAYGIQSRGEILVERIEGSYSNIVGLPISRLYEILRDEFDYRLI